jgi:pimeloyl-ACP methyl ester carboxylesterase
MKMLSKIDGEGKPIVLVPGGLTGWISWDKHTEILSRDRKVVRVQLLNVQLGFENKPLPSDYSVLTESKALAETLRELNLDKPFDIVGWSYGALTTLDYVLTYPENIHTVTLIEPPAFWVLRSNGPLDYEAEKGMRALKDFQGDITDDMLEKFLGAVGFLKPDESARELPQWNLWKQYKQSIRNSPAVINHNDNAERIKSFTKPVLLVKGTGSAGFLHQIIDVLNKYFPNSKVTEMPAGHGPHIVSMNRFLNEIREFQN